MPGIHNEDIVIRPVRRDDLPALVRIDEENSGENREQYLARRLDAALDARWGVAASNVIEVEGDVVGFIMVNVVSGEFGLPENVASVDTIGVLPAFGRMGLATELFDHTRDQLRKLGITRLQTLVGWREQDLLRFFAARGFTPGSMLFLESELGGG
ncbi:MAG: hypothetical protein MAG453_01002 [Calditrichaeota bacterium]|nr:hypothetical protein [Calditrichota bacterium]